MVVEVELVDGAFFIESCLLPSELDGIEQSPVEGLLPLGMSELEIEHPAVAFDHGQNVEFTKRCAIAEGSEMAPVELDLSSWLGFKPDEGLFGFGADLAQIVSQDADFAVKTLGLETLVDDGCRNLAVFFEQLVDLVLEGGRVCRA